MAAFLFASLPKILFPAAPVSGLADMLAIVLPYLLIAYAPVAGYRLATGLLCRRRAVSATRLPPVVLRQVAAPQPARGQQANLLMALRA